MAPAGEYPHAVLHFGGDAVFAEHRPRVAQSARLALDDEAPQRIAGVLHQPCALRGGLTMDAVVFQERGERRFDRTAEPAERGCLLLYDLVVERGDATSIRTLTSRW